MHLEKENNPDITKWKRYTHKNGVNLLDKKVSDVGDRLAIVNKILEEKYWDIIDEIENYNLCHPNTTDPLSNDIPVFNQLALMGDYLDYYVEKKEKKLSFVGDSNDVIDTVKKSKNYKKLSRVKLEEKDRSNEELNSYLNIINTLEKLMEKYFETNKDEYNKLKFIKSQIVDDAKLIKESLHGYIRFKRLGYTSTVYDINRDTGYFKDKPVVKYNKDKREWEEIYEEDNEWIEVSDNTIDLSNVKHVSALLRFYSSIKENTYYEIDSDLRHIMMVLDDVLDKTNLTEIEKEILILKIDELSNSEIQEILLDKYDVDYSDAKISTIFSTTIPKKIVKTYLEDVEDWKYTFVAKGKWKQCSKCGEIKLVHNFSINKDSKDGFHSVCKNCR